MNKHEFILELQNSTGYSAERCAVINNVLESYFIFRKKNKPKIVAELAEKLSVEEDEADRIYETCMRLIRTEKKRALKYPFGKR